jgi:hypothetical protein
LDALLGTSSPSDRSGRAAGGDEHNLFALCLTTPTAAAKCINQMYTSEACMDKANAGIEAASATSARTYKGAGGSWDLGWLDPAKYVGELQFLPILHESYYIVRAPIAAKLATTVANGGNQNKKGFGASGMIRGLSPKMWGLTVFDSGTAHSLIPPPVFEILKPALLSQLESQLQAQASTSAETQVLSRIFDDMCVPAPADGFTKRTITESFPVLQLVFRGFSETESGGRGRPFSLSWGPEYYLYSSPNNPFENLSRPAGNVRTVEGERENRQWLCSGIIPSGDRTVLGASFLRAFYTVFDRANKRIGIAPSTSKCIPAGECVNTCFTGGGEESIGGVAPRQLASFALFAAFNFAVFFLLACRRRCGRVVISTCGRCC